MRLTLSKFIAGSMILSAAFAHAKENVTNPKKGHLAPVLKIAAGCNPTTTQTDLDINNVRARIFTGGDMWWDLANVAKYEIPKGSGKTSLFAGSVWVGGYDGNGNLKAAGQTYRQQNANDFWTGPIAINNGSPDITPQNCQKFDRHWRITREEVEAFVSGSAPATKDIKEWPGNGNVANNELPVLAPFEDVNGDGIYDAASGDYPRFSLSGNFDNDTCIAGKEACTNFIFGDKVLWWVFNDVGNNKSETNSPAIGLEIRAQAFAFNTADEINNMTFYQYQIINRGSFTFDSTYFGMWADPDLGKYDDDYVGCDVGLGLGFCYNGDPIDDLPDGYGDHPPAVGLDFFQGPLADVNDGIDNDKDGFLDECGEQIIMSKFLFYDNNFEVTGNPENTDDYYQYLSGSWKDDIRWTWGGNGYNPLSNDYVDYFFPGSTDPSHGYWDEVTAGNTPFDRRFIQSAGPFTLLPGAVNYITVGAVWAQTSTGGPQESIALLKTADIKAQALFDNCFKTLDGPPAPDVEIRELDKKLVLTIKNILKNKDYLNVEAYSQIDPTISDSIELNGGIVAIPKEKKYYNFQGYLVYQVKDQTIGTTYEDLIDPNKAKLIAQLDLKDTITSIVNWDYDGALNDYVPSIIANGNESTNKGIAHTLLIERDLFTSAALINHKSYYFTVISYAYNNYESFQQIFPVADNPTQKKPGLIGRGNKFVYSGIPHISSVEASGIVLNSEFGTGVKIKRLDGTGNGGIILDMTEESIAEALTGPDYISKNPVYEMGKGPLNISVYDPFIVEHGHFDVAFDFYTRTVKFTEIDVNTETISIPSHYFSTAEVVVLTSDGGTIGGLTAGVPYYIIKFSPNTVKLASSAANANAGTAIDLTSVTFGSFRYTLTSKVFGDNSIWRLNEESTGSFDVADLPITTGNEQLIQTQISHYDPSQSKDIIDAFYDWGLTSKINQVSNPGSLAAIADGSNGFLEATQTFADENDQWLTGVKDDDFGVVGNWIDPDASVLASDPDNAYSKVLGGTWAPFKFAAKDFVSPQWGFSSLANSVPFAKLPSIDVVITSDKTKWTRACVLEADPDSGLSRFNLRRSASLDKNGNSMPGGSSSTDPASPNYIDSMGMSWFPGYAVNIETGERLNMAFAENSGDPGNNGNDMKWNPTGKLADGSNALYGGMHYIYVFNHNNSGTSDIPKYDACFKFDSLMRKGSANSVVKRNALKDIAWCSIPLLAPGKSFSLDNFNEVKIRIRVARAYEKFNPNFDTRILANDPSLINGQQYVSNKAGTIYNGDTLGVDECFYAGSVNFITAGDVSPSSNCKLPQYEFGTDGLEPSKADADAAKNALDLINVVPNPYYAYNSYEKKQNDTWVKITNLPAKCTVRIYTLSGTLIRTFDRDVPVDQSNGTKVGNSFGTEAGSGNSDTSMDWDIKNQKNIPINSGVYLININAPGIGERTVKWFGIIRPVDIDSY